MKEEAIDFIRYFVESEYKTLSMKAVELDQRLYDEQRARFRELFAYDDIYDGTQRSNPPNETELAQGRERIDKGRLIRRHLFQVKRYEHPSLGELFRAYLGLTTKERDQEPIYNLSLFFADTGGGFEIVSRYSMNRYPERHYDRTITDNGLEWVHQGGVELEELGDFQESVKLKTPGDRLGVLAEYILE